MNPEGVGTVVVDRVSVTVTTVVEKTLETVVPIVSIH